MKVAIITDTHFGVRSDAPAMFLSMRKFYEHVFFPTLDAYNITRVLHGGDYGDRRKYVNFGTARFIEDVYRKPLRERQIREDVIVGNHDCFYRDSTEVNSIVELYRHDRTHLRVYTQPTEVDIDGCGILMLPWICGNNREASERAIATSSCSVVLGHLELSGFQMYRGMPSHEGMDPTAFDRFGLVMSGHYHHRSSNGNIHYLGAPYPMVWSDYRDPRGFHIFDTDDHSLTFIPNPYTAFARVVYDDADQPSSYIEALTHEILAPTSEFHDAYIKVVVKSRTRPFWFDIMMDALNKVNPQDIMVVDDVALDTDAPETVETTDVDTITIMQDYVDGLSVSCDKQALHTYLRQLYQEATVSSQSSRLS